MTAFYFWLCRSPRSHKAEYLETLAEVRAALDTAAPLTEPVSDRTVEQRAWAIVHEEGPSWWNWYSRKYPNSKADEHQKRESMAHYCVVAALKQAVAATPSAPPSPQGDRQ